MICVPVKSGILFFHLLAMYEIALSQSLLFVECQHYSIDDFSDEPYLNIV